MTISAAVAAAGDTAAGPGIFELLRVNDDIRSAINRSASSSELERLAIANGMKTLLEDGLEKVKLGITAEDEVRRVAMEM